MNRRGFLNILTMICVPLLLFTDTRLPAFAKQAETVPRFIDMQYTVALCKGKPVGFWEYDYTILSTAKDLNFDFSLTIRKGYSVRVTRSVYEFYKSHPKELSVSLFASGNVGIYDQVQLHVPTVKSPHWHEWFKVDLQGSSPPQKEKGTQSSSGGTGQDTCPAGTVSCST